MDTPASVVDEVRDAARAHVTANQGEYAPAETLTSWVLACGDPMKLQLGIFVTYSHNGAHQRPPGPASVLCALC